MARLSDQTLWLRFLGKATSSFLLSVLCNKLRMSYGTWIQRFCRSLAVCNCELWVALYCMDFFCVPQDQEFRRFRVATTALLVWQWATCISKVGHTLTSFRTQPTMHTRCLRHLNSIGRTAVSSKWWLQSTDRSSVPTISMGKSNRNFSPCWKSLRKGIGFCIQVKTGRAEAKFLGVGDSRVENWGLRDCKKSGEKLFMVTPFYFYPSLRFVWFTCVVI